MLGELACFTKTPIGQFIGFQPSKKELPLWHKSNNLFNHVEAQRQANS
jgi:hypothetical protein